MIKKKLRILHAPINIAGQPAVISRAQRRLGYKSDVLVLNQNYSNYECDINLNLAYQPLLIKIIIRGINFIRCFFNYDIFHFHGGISLLHHNLDLPILIFFKKKVVMEYWGSDVIQTDIALKYTLWTPEDLNKIYPTIDNNKKRKMLTKISRLVNATIVGDHYLSPYSKKSKVVDKAIELNKFPFIGSKWKGKKVKIIHAPTHRNIKGTKFILEAIKKLEKENLPIEFKLVEKMPHHQAIEIYKKADIVIDSVLHGTYGILAIECMALGKPVLCYIHPNVKHLYKDLPIVNTQPNQVYQNLKKLILDPEKREILGIKGRKYVEEKHDSIIMAKKLINLYRKLS